MRVGSRDLPYFRNRCMRLPMISPPPQTFQKRNQWIGYQIDFVEVEEEELHFLVLAALRLDSRIEVRVGIVEGNKFVILTAGESSFG